MHGQQNLKLTTLSPKYSHLDMALGKQIYVFSKTPGPALGPTQPPLQWVPDFLTDGKCHDVRHLPPTNAQIKNEWSFTSSLLKCHFSEHNKNDFDLRNFS